MVTDLLHIVHTSM